MRRSVFSFVAFLVVLPFFHSASAARADELSDSLGDLAQATRWIVAQQQAASVSVGEFTGPPSLKAAAGTGLRLELERELKRAGVRVADDSPVGIQGKYFLEGEDGERKTLTVEATYVDRNGRTLSGLSQKLKVPRPGVRYDEGFEPELEVKAGVIAFPVYGDVKDSSGREFISRLTGATVDLKPPKKNVDDFEDPPSINDPTTARAAVKHEGGWIAASSTSPFAMRILVDGKPREPELRNGQPYVRLDKGESFVVHFSNQANHTAAASLTLDGIDRYHFSENKDAAGRPLYHYVLLNRRSVMTIDGWHKNNETITDFLVTDFENSAAAKARSSAAVGAITATFRASWRKQEARPSDEPELFGAAAFDEGIGEGDRRTQRVEVDPNPREYGVPRAVITIRYEKTPENERN